jgi:hypothetical protein
MFDKRRSSTICKNTQAMDSSFLECDTVSLGEWFHTFWRIAVPASSRSISPSSNNSFFFDYMALKMKALHSFKTSETTHTMTQCHIPEYLSLQQHCCDNFTACNLGNAQHFSSYTAPALHGNQGYSWLDTSRFNVDAGRTETWAYLYGPMAVLLILNTVYFIWTAWRLWKDCQGQSAPKLRCLRFTWVFLSAFKRDLLWWRYTE